MEVLKPNFTQIPNIVLDELLGKLNGSEIKVLFYICRRTYGFQKESDNISISQLQNGIITQKGERLDYGTGLSNRKVIDAILRLEEIGVIETIKKHRKTTSFKLKLDYKIPSEESSHKKSSVKKVHTTSEESSHKLVKKVHTQKKEKESTQKKVLAETSSAVISSQLKKPRTDQDIIDILDILRPLNETGSSLWYGNKTERKAAKTILKQFKSKEVIQEKLNIILEKKEATEPYAFPFPNSPYELIMKYEKIKRWLNKQSL